MDILILLDIEADCRHCTVEVALRVEHKDPIEVLVDVVNLNLKGRGLLGDKGS